MRNIMIASRAHGGRALKTSSISLLMLSLFLMGCNSTISPAPTRLWSTSTSSDIPTSQQLPIWTRTTVPVMTEISCEPASNPFDDNPLTNPGEYVAGYYPNITITRVCTFDGTVSKGQVYKHRITQDLVFCLVPSGISGKVPDEGWTIVISDSHPGSCDFNSEDYVNFGPIVSPPFRGNPLFDVYGWHFRNKENTGENRGSVNAPQEVREFNFVFNRKDYETEWHAARCRDWGISIDCALTTKTNQNIETPRSRAKFTITKLKLGNLVPGSMAWIEDMEFKVEIYMPKE
jgi:hypothetical protein